MDAKPSTGESEDSNRPSKIQLARDNGCKLERVLSFWGSYCYADLSTWTQDEIDDFADALELKPKTRRRKRRVGRSDRSVSGDSIDKK